MGAHVNTKKYRLEQKQNTKTTTVAVATTVISMYLPQLILCGLIMTTTTIVIVSITIISMNIPLLVVGLLLLLIFLFLL